MKQGTIGLFNSKRGVFCTFLIVLAFVLVLLGKLEGSAWADFAKWIAAFLVTGHTVSGVLADKASAQPPPSSPS